MLEPPYGIIWNRMKTGKVVPFLGAGASFVGRPPNAQWDVTHPRFLPSGRELSRALASESTFPVDAPGDAENLAKVASYYADVSGRDVLRERLHDLLSGGFSYGPLHELLASVPTPQIIVVTNYDTLLEQAFHAAGKPYDLVVHPADRMDIANAVLWWPHGSTEPIVKAPNELDIDLGSTTVIYKMHGTVSRESPEWDNFVITEEDYVEFLSRMTSNSAVPSIFFECFRERSFLFIGYGLGDWNLRVILKNLGKLLSPERGKGSRNALPSWAIQYKPSELERLLWTKRNVHIFDMTVDEFVAKLRERQQGG